MKYLSLLLLCLFMCSWPSCKDESRPDKTDPPPAPATTAEKSSDEEKARKLQDSIDDEKNEVKRLKLELELLRLQKSIADKASADAETRIKLKQKELDDVRLEALQTKLYISAGVLVLITAVLVGLAVYFKSAHMFYWACGTGAIASLVAFAGFLTPYVYWIAGAGMVGLISFVCWLLFGRDKALFQLTRGMNDMKAHVPQYRDILRQHVDDAQDKIIDATRKRWHDPQV